MSDREALAAALETFDNRFEAQTAGEWLSAIPALATAGRERLAQLNQNPVGYLVYDEFIPYDVWLEHLPYAAPVDQVIALYTLDQVGEPG